MTGEEFVKSVFDEKQQLINEYFKENSQTMAGIKIRELISKGIPKEQLYELVEMILTDAYYGFLLGLEGSASLGDKQAEYKIYDEDGMLLNECGEIEENAYKYFIEGCE